MNRSILSICVPTFNRARELARFFNSVPSSSLTEIVICDDGSNDNTKEIVERYAGILNIKYLFQENSGRANALYNAINAASGEFTILMDSDDYFTGDGLGVILETLGSEETFDAFMFGISILENKELTPNLPPDLESNFIAIRADYGVKRDLKEVVRTSILQSCNVEPKTNWRRVPTSLLWSRVAENVNCLSVTRAVVVKEYLPGGMSDKILSLKSSNPAPLVELNTLLSQSKRYRSTLYRWRSRLMWARYSFHADDFVMAHWWQWLVLFPGWCIYNVDRLNLVRQKARK